MAGPSRIARISATLIISEIYALGFPLLDAQAQFSNVPTPAYMTFDDVVSPDLPGPGFLGFPATGGINQPTIRQEFSSGWIVSDSALGIDTQPVWISQTGPDAPNNLRSDFAPVSSGMVRVEATVSLNLPPENVGLLLSSGGPVTLDEEIASDLARIGARMSNLPTGEIFTFQGIIITEVTLGSFENNKPFRIRIDINLNAKTWSVIIDDELNGFDDDSLVSGLSFNIISNGVFGTINAFWNCLPCTTPGGGSALTGQVAYDDISVSVNGFTVVPLDIVDKSINVCNKSPIKAAALGRPFYDTADIDPATMTLAGAPIRTTGKDETPQAKVKDTDHDGNPDLEAVFVSQDLALTSQDQFAVLQAETFDNAPIEGLDAVSVRELMCSRSAAGALLVQ